MTVLWNSQFLFTEMIGQNIIEYGMRRTSLTPAQARHLATVVRRRRVELGLSMRQLASLAGVQLATVAGVEAARILAPQPDTLSALADPLGIAISDLYVAIGWLPAGELPTLRPYMRAKYSELSDVDLAELEAFAERLVKRHGDLGPRDREDEDPE